LEVRLSNGVEVREGDTKILLDPRRTEPGVVSLVTHAHADHVPRDVRRSTSPLACTRPTADVISARYGEIKEPLIVEFGEPLEIGGLTVTAYPAGHVLGSAMFLVEGRRGSLLYTGDVNPLGGLTVESPAEVPRADVLVMESTYGSPRFGFPHPQRVRTDLALWAAGVIGEGGRPAVLAYAVGKAQEVIAALNRMLDVPVLADREVLRVTEVYRRHSRVRLEARPAGEGGEGPAILVVSSRGVAADARLSLATGWTVLRVPRWADAGFPLSSHADYGGLIEVARRSGAGKAFTVWGRTKDLAWGLTAELGVEARPLGLKWESAP